MELFEALADDSRRRILELLRGGPATVGMLVEHLDLSQPGVSKHLRILKETGLVQVTPDGQRRWYSIRPEGMQGIDEWLEPYRSLWNDRLDQLERHLDQPGPRSTPS